MPEGELTVVISAGQSRNPEKRSLEQGVAELASQLPGVRVLRIPHLYDLAKDGETFRILQALDGDLVLITWMYARAAHWILDRNSVRGQVGEVLLTQDLGDDEEDADGTDALEDEARVIVAQPRPARKIYTLDFRASQATQDFVDEIDRIRQLPRESSSATSLTLEMLARYDEPTNDTYLGSGSSQTSAAAQNPAATLFGTASLVSIEEHPARRWYPVIDFSRCTNCMECIDFCLFGVYGIDAMETINVEQADNCRKGCPACSRVCPQNAIIFPQHKTPAIAGAPVDSGGLKIDLSKLFGAPEENEDAAAAAIRERDEQLLLAGRSAVGDSVGIRSRLADRAEQAPQADALDDLIDELDALDL